jgi:hypothetical protein
LDKRNAKRVQCFAWDVFRAASRARWVGRIEAATADAAIEAAAVEFKMDAWKLIAVRRREIVQECRWCSMTRMSADG